MTSTSGRLATGLKKCRPTNLPGSRSAPASVSSRMLDVFVAISARGRQTRLEIARTARVSPRPSRRSLRSRDPRSRLPLPRDRRADGRVAASASPGRAQALAKQLARARQARARRTVGRDPAASPSSPFSAHHAAMSPPIVPAPTTCTRRMRAVLRRQVAQPLAQLEHVHQIPAGLRDEQLADRHRLGAQRGVAARAVTLPKIDDRVRRRIVLAPRALADARRARAQRRTGATACDSAPPSTTARGVEEGGARSDPSPSRAAPRGRRLDRRGRPSTPRAATATAPSA